MVLVTDRTAQTVETRRRRSLQLNLIALWQRRRAEDIAVQVALFGRQRVIDTRCTRANERYLGRGRILLELDIGTAVVAHTHNLVVGILNALRTEQVVGEQVDGLAQHLRAHLQLIVVDDIQTAILDRIKTLHKAAVATRHGRIVVREEVHVAQSIDRIVVHNRLTSIVVARQHLTYLNGDIGTIAAHRGIDLVENVVDREVEVTVIAQHCANSRALLVQYRKVQHITLAQQRRGGICQNNRFEETITETILDLPDAIGLSLLGAVGHNGAAARGGIDLVRGLRIEVAARVHIDLDVRGRALGLQRVEIYGSLANAAFEVIPPILLVGICREVGPQIEIGTQEALVRLLAHIAIDLGSRDTLVTRHALIDLDLVLLEQILPLRNTARHATSHSHRRHNEQTYHSAPKFHITIAIHCSHCALGRDKIALVRKNPCQIRRHEHTLSNLQK